MHYVDVTHNKELESVFAHRIKTAGFKVSLHMISACGPVQRHSTLLQIKVL